MKRPGGTGPFCWVEWYIGAVPVPVTQTLIDALGEPRKGSGWPPDDSRSAATRASLGPFSDLEGPFSTQTNAFHQQKLPGMG